MKKFRLYDNILGWLVFAIAAVTYLLTIEPTVSFWDCGEFIASSYKLEVGHPPGNPTFQMIARIFTLFVDPAHAAAAVNAMSALCAAFTILFLFWSISHLGRRLMEKRGMPIRLPEAIGIWGAAAVGALAYTWSDTFWFSAVEAEVYAMSSLFTAAVFWCMLKWEECADAPHANRWIVLIAYLMGLSIGVHLLNLLAIPALVFIYYYKKYNFTWKGAIFTFLISLGILAVILYAIIPGVLKMAGGVDYLFVNTFHLPFNTGMVFFAVLLFCLLFWGIFRTQKKGKVLWHTILLSLTVFFIGYTSFAMVVIRSSAMTPTNENQPDNAFALGRYLGREQYGSAPLLYGGVYNKLPAGITDPTITTKLGDKYIRYSGVGNYYFNAEDEMLFPRMHDRRESSASFYRQYQKNSNRKPTMGENLGFFFDYQMHYMYWRYFFWNFVGRQNDLHGTKPGDPVHGNWESGISFIDRMHLGDESMAPQSLKDNKARNHFYFLPFILGLVGLFYQLVHNRQNAWITFLLFIFTGIAIVVYLNQPPFQPRERDYAYAGSFYAFAIWIGLGVMGLQDVLSSALKNKKTVAAVLAVVAGLMVPVQMVSQTWDDHDRSDRYTAREMAVNYLQTCLPGAILISHGDNDTFPLWYAQEVEGVRTDVRIMNTSLMGVDWYIDQMQYRYYDSDPVKFVIPKELYLYGCNEQVPVVDRVESRVKVSQAIGFLANPKNKFRTESGDAFSYLPARKFRIPVNRENALASGIVAPDKAHLIPEYLDFDIPEGHDYISKFEMMFLDMISTYDWSRPIYMVNRATDLNVGLRDYFQKDGMVYRFVPYKAKLADGTTEIMDTDAMMEKMLDTYQWLSLGSSSIYCDYQNIYTFAVVTNLRGIYTDLARQLALENRKEDCVKVLDALQTIMPAHNFPLCFAAVPSYNELAVMEMIELYYFADAREKARDLAGKFLLEDVDYVTYLLQPYAGGYLSRYEGETCLRYFYEVLSILREHKDDEMADQWSKLMDAYAGK